MIKKLKGIVISETNYGESSKILNLYTEELGVIGVLSKGCKKLKSPLRSVSNKLVYGEFIVYYKENALSTLTSVDVINSFKNIMTDIKKVSYATFILELTSQVLKQNDSNEIFNLFISSLEKINDSFDPLIITDIIELKYLKYLGVDINLDECVICGSKDNIITLSSEKAGYICKECYSNEKIVSDKTIKVIRMLYYVDIDKLTNIKLNETTIKEIDSFINEYYDLYTGLYLKSKDFLKKII